MAFLRKIIKNPTIAFLVLAVYAFGYGCLNTYPPSMVTTLEKRFDLDTSRMGFLLAANDIGYFLTIVSVAYYGGHNHHVRCLVLSALGLGISGFINAVPYAVFGPRYSVDQLRASNSSGKAFGGASMTYGMACRNVSSTKAPRDATENATIVVSAMEQTTMFVIQMIAGIISGMAASPFWNVGISFLDDISGKRSGGFIGLLLAIRCVAPIFGFMFGSFLNTVNESVSMLVKDYPAGQKDPFWIGAWWVGFLVLGAAVGITAPFLAMFDTAALQRRIQRSPEVDIPLRERLDTDEGNDEGEAEEENKKALEEGGHTKMEEASLVADVYGDFESEVVGHPEGSQPPPPLSLKDMVIVYKKLWSNPVFYLNMIGKVLECFSHVVIMTFFPKFLELHFRLTASQANLASAFLLAGAAIVATLLGGQIAQKWPLSPKKSNFVHALTNTIYAVGFPLLFVFVCEPKPMMGSPMNSLNLTCTSNACECVKTFKPVCINGENYFSACKAACQTYDGSQNIFKNCLCTGAEASPGVCPGMCDLIYPYGAFFFIIRVIGIIAVVYFMKMNMSLTEYRNKPISLASVGFLFGVTGTIIPPLLGKIFDHSCLMHNAAGRGPRSFCALYDVEKLRILLHLIAFLPLIPSSVCYFLSWYVMKDDSEQNQTADA